MFPMLVAGFTLRWTWRVQEASAAPSLAAPASLPNGVSQAPDTKQVPLEKQPGALITLTGPRLSCSS